MKICPTRIANSRDAVASLSLVALLAAAVWSAPRCALADYTFIKIADSSGALGTNFGMPDINDGGTVAFFNIEDNGTTTGIRTGNGGPTTLQVSNQGAFSLLSPAPSINSAGAVAFWASAAVNGVGIHIALDTSVTTVADVTNSLFYDFGNLPSINDAGGVSYSGNLYSPCCGAAIGLGTAVMYDESSPLNGFGATSLNGAGTIAFVAVLDGGGYGVFAGSGGPLTTIAASGATFSSFPSPCNINDSGAVAFIATLVSGGSGIFIGSGGPVTTVTTTAGPFDAYGAHGVGFNGNGDVAFLAHSDGGDWGIYSGPDPVADKVIKVGDQLFGAPVYSLSMSNGLKNQGDIVFTYVLENESGGAGVAGVAVAKAAATIPGDLDGDGDVDGADLGALLGSWGSCSGCPADINGDGVVNGADLGILLGHWG